MHSGSSDALNAKGANVHSAHSQKGHSCGNPPHSLCIKQGIGTSIEGVRAIYCKVQICSSTSSESLVRGQEKSRVRTGRTLAAPLLPRTDTGRNHELVEGLTEKKQVREALSVLNRLGAVEVQRLSPFVHSNSLVCVDLSCLVTDWITGALGLARTG